MRTYSLEELEKTKNKLEKWIKYEKESLDDYQHFYKMEGEYYFSLSFSGIHLNAEHTKLKDLFDIKTRKPLTKLEKKHIGNTCKNIVHMEGRLSEVNHKIFKFYFSDDLGGESEKTKNKKNRIRDKTLIEEYIELALKLGDIPKGKKHHTTTLYRKLNNRYFLTSLINTIMKKKDSNYNYSEDNFYLLDKLYNHFSSKLLGIVNMDDIGEKHPKEFEYKDGIDYSNHL